MKTIIHITQHTQIGITLWKWPCICPNITCQGYSKGGVVVLSKRNAWKISSVIFFLINKAHYNNQLKKEYKPKGKRKYSKVCLVWGLFVFIITTMKHKASARNCVKYHFRTAFYHRSLNSVSHAASRSLCTEKYIFIKWNQGLKTWRTVTIRVIQFTILKLCSSGKFVLF